jgi:hypothetical protein
MDDTYSIEDLLKSIRYNSKSLNISLNSQPRTYSSFDVKIITPNKKRIKPIEQKNTLFFDGIQKYLILEFIESRPIALQYTSSAGVTRLGEPLIFLENLEIVASKLDSNLVNSYPTNIKKVYIDNSSALDLDDSFTLNLQNNRYNLETLLIKQTAESQKYNDYLLISDGFLPDVTTPTKLAAVSKTINTKYLEDESILLDLLPGEISPVFSIERNQTGSIYSCYLKLVGDGKYPWNFGLVRLEAFTNDSLELVAGVVLANSQKINHTDLRWDRQIRPIFLCEQFLKARAPKIFNLL